MTEFVRPKWNQGCAGDGVANLGVASVSNTVPQFILVHTLRQCGQAEEVKDVQ